MPLKPIEQLADVAPESKPLAAPVAREIARLTSAVEAATGVLENEQHELFAQNVTKGMTQQSAYVAAYPNCSEDSAWASSSRLMRNPVVRARVRTLQGLTATDLVLNMQERREYLADVLRTPLAEVNRNSPLCQEWSETITKDGGSERIKMPDKLAAIKLDAQLAGELDPDEGKGNIDAGKLATDLIAFVVGLVKPEKRADAIEV